MTTKLYNIDALMVGKKPGEIRVSSEDLDRGATFVPYFKTGAVWYGVDGAGRLATYHGDLVFWHIYQEPKKKIKRWLWASQKYAAISTCLLTEEEATIYSPAPRVSKGLFTIKLLWSETEFSELDT